MGIVFGRTGVTEPVYDVLLSRSTTSFPYEVRKYGKRFAIETTYARDEDPGKSFMKLAKYIGVTSAPQNDGDVSIAMTAPVITNEVQSKGGKQIAMTAPVVTTNAYMQFILPSEYDSPGKIPKPLDSTVRIAEVPSAVGAVYRFSGWVNTEQATEKIKSLNNQLNEDGVSIKEEEAIARSQLWQFHPPFTIPFLRRNEVWIELTEKQVRDLMKKFEES